MKNKDFFYVHRTKGEMRISPATPIKQYMGKLYRTEPMLFGFYKSNVSRCDFKTGMHYHLWEVRVNDKGVIKHWGYIDDVVNCVYFNSFLPSKRIADFKELLESLNIHLIYGEIKVKYVEICLRYQKEKTEEVNKILPIMIQNFNTNRTDPMTRDISDGEWYTSLIKNLYTDDHYFNLKNYLYVENFKSENQSISENRLPKLEIQIKGVRTIEKAIEIGLPILKGIVEAVGLETVPMDKNFEKDDYELLMCPGAFGHSKKVVNCLKKEPKRKILPILPKSITNNETDYKIVSYLWSKCDGLKNICTQLNISEKTFYRSSKKLGGVIERRGDKGSGYVYQIDHIYLNNITHV